MVWTLAEMRLLLFDTAVPYEWSDALLASILVDQPNKYKAAAILCRAKAVEYGREAYSYKTTDGKAMDKRQRAAELRALADDFEKQAKSCPADAMVLGKYAVADTGEDLTEFEEE